MAYFIDKKVIQNPQSFFERCNREIPFERVKWGRTGRYLPRQIYAYQGNISVLEELKTKIELHYGCVVSNIWCNLYVDGNDYTPYHKDSYNCQVYTLSLGATRNFRVKGEITKTFKLENGDIFYFDQNFNDNHQHTVPKQPSIKEPRISIVFFCN